MMKVAKKIMMKREGRTMGATYCAYDNDADNEMSQQTNKTKKANCTDVEPEANTAICGSTVWTPSTNWSGWPWAYQV